MDIATGQIYENWLGKPIKWTVILSCEPPKTHKPNQMGGTILSIPLLSRMRSYCPNRTRGLISDLLTVFFFFSISRSCPQAYRGGGHQRKSPVDCAVDFISKIYHNITTVSFFFQHTFLYKPESPQMSIKDIWMMPKHNLDNFKVLWWFLFIKCWSS